MKSRLALYLLIVTTISLQLASSLLAVEAPTPRGRSEVEAVLVKAPN